MSKLRIVHYINQFFANIGGEEKADYQPELREGIVGPGVQPGIWRRSRNRSYRYLR